LWVLADIFAATKEENIGLKAENDHLKREHDVFRATLSKLQMNQCQMTTSNPFGPIGSNPGLPAFRRALATKQSDNNTSMEAASVPSPAESENQSAQVESMLRHLGGSF
jgi:hypothetical protein